MSKRKYSGGFDIYPRVLDTNPTYKLLPPDAKLLYIKLRSLHDLSTKNKDIFSDEYGIYVVFPMTNVCELLNCKKDKAAKIVSKLVDAGLIKRRRADCGKALRTYVTDLTEHVDECTAKKTTIDERQNGTTSDPQIASTDERINRAIVSDKNASRYNETINHYLDNPNSSSIYTNWDLTEGFIQDNIAYELLCNEYTSERIDSIVRIITANYCKDVEYIKISGTDIPIQRFRSAMDSLDEMHIRSVIKKIDNVDTTINNLESYYLRLLWSEALRNGA